MDQPSSTMPPVTAKPADKPKRLLSLDALRGFDMFWIVSGEGIFHGLANGIKEDHALIQDPHNWTIATNPNLSLIERILVGISNQLHHSPWNGFTFYDLIFPLFIFISGVSMPFSYQKYFTEKETGNASTGKIYYALIRRTLILILLGAVVNGMLQLKGYEHIRFASVLGRIGLATFFAALIYLNTSLKKQIIWFVSILAGYFLLMKYVPVPGFGSGIFTPEGNLSAYLDRLLLPGKLHRTVYDPEGLLSTLPAICSAMLGIFTGKFMQDKALCPNPAKKVGYLILSGIVLLLIAVAGSFFFPINKTMWTSTFVLFAGGWSILLFALFYYLIDVRNYQKWCMPMVWIGTNSILIYVCAHGLFNFESTSSFLFGGIINAIPTAWQQAGLWTGVLIIQLFGLKFLFDKKWFLKI
ncbi:acyltransferase family protein [Pedobacter kyungheensis]|nr:DUF5009 domain-containing protein [Pedobacter kyungheensis]